MLPSPNFCVPSQFVNWSAQPLEPPSEMYASALHDMRSTKARKLSMELSVNWTSFVAKSFVQLVTRVRMGGSNHSCMRIAPWAKNCGDSIMRHGHTRRGSRNNMPRASCATLNSLRGTHRRHLLHAIAGTGRRPLQSEHPCRGFKRPRSVILFCFFLME